MTTFADQPVLKLYAIVATALALHLVFLALWTGRVRFQHKRWVNPEDAKINKGEQADSDHPDTLRVKRAHQNAIENAIPFFAIGLLYVLSGASKTGAQAYFFTFLGARVLHSLFYLWGRQPFRSLMFAAGVLAMFGMSYQILRAAL